MKLITCDFETYFDTAYSLRSKKYNTSQYIRDDQFLVHCCGVKIGAMKTVVYHRDELPALFKSINWADTALLAQNTAFDGAILAWHYNIVPAFYYDTLSMSRALHFEQSRAGLDAVAQLYQIGAKSKTYLTEAKGLRELPPAVYKDLANGCKTDVDLCYGIFKKQFKVYPAFELDLIDMTIRMFTEPVLKVDDARAHRALDIELRQNQELISSAGVPKTVLTSNPQFAEALIALGVDPPMKFSPYNGQLTYALSQSDEDFIELLEHEDRRVQLLVAGRLAAKSTLIETRSHRLIEAGKDGASLPIGLNYWGAKTGRWSGANKLNAQNMPRGSELRKSIIAPSGYVIVVADSAQIEARMLAWLAGQDDLVQAFRDKRDVYCEMAASVFCKPINKKDHPTERFVGKVATLGLGYGMGHKKFQATLAKGLMGPAVKLNLTFCFQVVQTYRSKNAKIKSLWDAADTILRLMCASKTGEWKTKNLVIPYDPENIWLPNGLSLQYPGLRMDETGNFCFISRGVWKKIYGALLIENLVQALARIVVAEQMLEINQSYRVASMSHDEVIAVAPEKEGDKALGIMLAAMRTPPEWCTGVPLDAEGGYAKEYSK
jgi:hypothetical protein